MNTALKVPSFYKNDISEEYLGVISGEKLIRICYVSFTGANLTVQVLQSDEKIINNCMPFMHEIPESEFYTAYNKCLQDITKEVATATAYDEQKLSITGS